MRRGVGTDELLALVHPHGIRDDMARGSGLATGWSGAPSGRSSLGSLLASLVGALNANVGHHLQPDASPLKNRRAR